MVWGSTGETKVGVMEWGGVAERGVGSCMRAVDTAQDADL